MPTPPVPEETIRARAEAYHQAVAQGHPEMGASVKAGQVSALIIAGRKCGVDANQIRRAVTKIGERPVQTTAILPEFPDDDISTEEIIDGMDRRFTKRFTAIKAREWFPIKLRDNKPIGIMWFGDPHVDDDGCNWPLLRKHIALCRETEGLYGANIGDSTNNWCGRLMRLFADQETSQKTARRLARWLLCESGVNWLLWLLGNHDSWGDGAAILKEMNRTARIPIEDWGAQFRLVWPNGFERRIWAAHDFQGHSMWNSLHSLQRAAHTKTHAHLYVAGHTHNWALHQEESASRDFTYWLARARGYKFIDPHATHHGHASQDEGASVVAVFNPQAKNEASAIQCFADPEIGVNYLRFLRGRK